MGREASGSVNGCSPLPCDDHTRAVLDWVQELLAAPGAGQRPLAQLLAGLARALNASGAGLAAPLEGRLTVRQRVWLNGQPAPAGPSSWEERQDLLVQLRETPTALPVRTTEGMSALVTLAWHAGGAGCLLWVEDAGERTW